MAKFVDRQAELHELNGLVDSGKQGRREWRFLSVLGSTVGNGGGDTSQSGSRLIALGRS